MSQVREYVRLIADAKIRVGQLRARIAKLQPVSISNHHLIDNLQFTAKLIEHDIARIESEQKSAMGLRRAG